MKLILSLFLLLILLVACGATEDVGGRLPMIVTQWEDDIDGDILRWFIYEGYPETFATPVQQTEGIARIGDDFPVPRAMAAKMLALASVDPYTIDAWARYPSIAFSDVAQGAWYFPYINAVYVLSQMSGGGETFRPRDMLTLHEAGLLMTNINPQGPGLLVTQENRGLPISYALWVDLFIQYLGAMEEKDVMDTVQVIPLQSNAERITTNIGSFSSAGINMAHYLNQEVKILHRDGEIVALLGLVNPEPYLRGAFILERDSLGLTVSIGGFTGRFVYAHGVEPLGDGTIADIQISGGNIINTVPSEKIIRGTIEQVGASRIMLREWGLLPLRASFAVYSINGERKSPADLIVGANIADFHITGGAIGAAIVTDTASPVNIRVLIGTSNFAGVIHDRVSITSTGSFIAAGETLAAGEIFSVSGDDLADGSRVYIEPTSPDYRLEIIGLVRNQPTPLYRGRIEITRSNGGFVIVNELCLEEYLYAVVPSEMPSFFGLEAAKVQAVTARTFAIHQFYENRFRAFGAHVDDSVISQVYNNIPENDISREAVRATAGQVLMYNGEIIIANFFSTSSGATANFGEVWASGSNFPGNTPVYLSSALQFDEDEISDRALRNAVRDLSREENADLFFRASDIPAFERDLPWFRWQVRMTAEELSGSINQSLASRQQANPSMIHTLDASGVATARRLDSIGRITNLEITRRGQGGNVMEVIISGTQGNVRVQTEFNIRTLLAPRSAVVTRINSGDVNNLSLMPSGFFTIEKETDTSGNLIAIVFYGGGHGHGVGMSQNGANVLLNMGYTYRDVLMHFYPGTELRLY
ncbi:MAG: SpoIID/LytB domain-containing protein [Defluviitaleaceae bacterium]|nr:SpoIID/LytB domain-containing protein [Defluviitaleaceae bacterium]